jgi:hypothetical protein
MSGVGLLPLDILRPPREGDSMGRAAGFVCRSKAYHRPLTAPHLTHSILTLPGRCCRGRLRRACSCSPRGDRIGHLFCPRGGGGGRGRRGGVGRAEQKSEGGGVGGRGVASLPGLRRARVSRVSRVSRRAGWRRQAGVHDDKAERFATGSGAAPSHPNLSLAVWWGKGVGHFFLTCLCFPREHDLVSEEQRRQRNMGTTKTIAWSVFLPFSHIQRSPPPI